MVVIEFSLFLRPGIMLGPAVVGVDGTPHPLCGRLWSDANPIWVVVSCHWQASSLVAGYTFAGWWDLYGPSC